MGYSVPNLSEVVTCIPTFGLWNHANAWRFYCLVKTTMLTVEQCRKLLSTEENISDTELESVRDELYAFAELAFEIYQADVESGSKNPLGLLQSFRLSNTV